MRLHRPMIVFVFVLATAVVAARQTDPFAVLGVPAADANDNFMASLTSGTLALRGQAAAFKAASPDVRATLVRGVVQAARTYMSSGDFAKRYAEWREGMRPQPETVPQSGDEALALQQKQLEEVIKEAQKMSAELPPDARKQLADNIAEMKKQLAELNADPEHRKTVDAAAKDVARQVAADNAQREAEFDVEYPADPKKLIAKRLRDFLQVSATVDFSAKLVEKDKKMRFADPELESKPREWKLYYRAGKPAIDAARAAAQDWLKALGG